jgi:pimeloyl-ACP methyl ester carboxylesterase
MRAYGETTLGEGIRSRFIPGVNGLTMHLLEAGHEPPGRPTVLLLHGFPELAYSWRRIMLPLASAGYHVIAPDQRGYGRTTGWDPSYDGDLGSFRVLNIVRDTVGLLSALGIRSVRCIVGHDFGSWIAAYSALVRPDLFRSVVMMSAPFSGPPSLPFDTARTPVATPAATGVAAIESALESLPRPRKHYHWYYSTREANPDMHGSREHVHAFMRAYYHHKSADWTKNTPFRLAGWTAEELAKLPTYYVMDRDVGMAATVAAEAPTAAEIAACRWLTEDELAVYSSEYARTGFQGGLNWYRCRFVGAYTAEAEIFSGRSIDVPSAFISGQSDWGVFQTPGAYETMQSKACSDMRLCELVPGAGHWVQQEQPEAVLRLLLRFLDQASQG